MAKYVTAQKWRTMAFGTDASELDDLELEALCQQASLMVDTHCNVPRIPQYHDFKGGTITGEQHHWRYPFGDFDIGQRRVYPYHWPIKTVGRLRIYVTRTQYVEIASADMVINNQERYIEVVSLALTSSGLFNALIVPNVGLATPIAYVDYTYGWDFGVVGEILLATDAALWRAENQFWDTTPTPVVYVNGSAQTRDYSVDYTEGTVAFSAMPAVGAVVTVDYHHRLPREIMYGAGWVVADLHGEAELHAKGMAHLNQIKLGELTITRTAPRAAVDGSDLASFSPRASSYLASFKNDHIAVG